MLVLLPIFCFSQNKRAELELQKKKLQQEIVQINSLISSNTKKRVNVLTKVESIQLKMDRQDALIRLTNTQINNLTQDININLRNIEKLRTELEKLKTTANAIIENIEPKRIIFFFLVIVLKLKNCFILSIFL